MDSARNLRFVLGCMLLAAWAPGLKAAEMAEKLSLRPAHRSGEQSRVEIALQVGLIQGTDMPSIGRKAMLLFCADHGVVQEGVSPFPSEITGLMVRNFLRGGAAINVLARHGGIQIHVVDAGVDGDWPAELLRQPNFFQRGTVLECNVAGDDTLNCLGHNEYSTLQDAILRKFNYIPVLLGDKPCPRRVNLGVGAPPTTIGAEAGFRK
jgi:hypothetical protein